MEIKKVMAVENLNIKEAKEKVLKIGRNTNLGDDIQYHEGGLRRGESEFIGSSYASILKKNLPEDKKLVSEVVTNKEFIDQVNDRLEKNIKKYVREEIERAKVEILDKMQELEEKLEKRFDEKIKAMKEKIREEIKIMINEMISQNER